MSFTSIVKEEISKIDINEMNAISQLSSIVQNSDFNENEIVIVTFNNSVARCIFSLFKKIFNVYVKITVRQGYNYNKKMIYILKIDKEVPRILNKLGINSSIPSDFILSDDELLRSYLRGLFMICGSVNDPKTARYHLEFNLNNEKYALFLMNKLTLFGAKVLHRDNKYMLYIKEAEKISDFLRMINAYNAVLYFEDIRIYRDHKNMTNRLNNCEQANVDRMMDTASRQVNDIEIIEENGCGDFLSENERVVAFYRLKYRDVSLSELAEIISLETGVKITKSGLYHRFKKISVLANKVREKINK